LEEKKYDEVIEEYKKAISELPNPSMTHNNLGLVLLKGSMRSLRGIKKAVNKTQTND
jgi:hypothetical protein